MLIAAAIKIIISDGILKKREAPCRMAPHEDEIWE